MLVGGLSAHGAAGGCGCTGEEPGLPRRKGALVEDERSPGQGLAAMGTRPWTWEWWSSVNKWKKMEATMRGLLSAVGVMRLWKKKLKMGMVNLRALFRLIRMMRLYR